MYTKPIHTQIKYGREIRHKNQFGGVFIYYDVSLCTSFR